MRGEVLAARREVAGDRGATGAQGRARLQIGGRPRGGAYVEHAPHVCDPGGVEAQWLVEHRRALPRVERRACNAGLRAGRGRREAAGDCGARSVYFRAGRDCKLGAGHGEDRTSNMPYMFVTLEVSQLSSWLNADAFCRESKGGQTRCGASNGPGSKRRWATASQGASRGGFECRCGGRICSSWLCVKGVRHKQRAGGGSDRRLREGQARSAPRTSVSCL